MRRFIAAVMVSSLIGCTTFGPVNARQFVAERRPMHVWVTTLDSSVLTVQRPRFLGDTLTGFVRGKYRKMQPHEVQIVRALRPAPKRTVILVVGTAAALTIGAWLVSGAGQGDFATLDNDLGIMTREATH